MASGWPAPSSQRGDDGPGGGQGLILHGTLLTVLGGSLAVESAPGRGTRVTLRVPPTAPHPRRERQALGSG